MPIRFRCEHCHGLLAISSRKAGSRVDCPTCGQPTDVPDETPEPPDGSARELMPAGQSATSKQVPDRVEPEGEDDAADPGFRLRKGKFETDEMDLTPMVDVTFLLLIFFMVTASFSLQKSIQTPGSDSDKKGATQSPQTLEDLESTSIMLQIDRNNTIRIDDQPAALGETLADLLRDKMQREKKTELVVSAHRDARHRSVVEVLDSATAAGLQKIRLVSRILPDE